MKLPSLRIVSRVALVSAVATILGIVLADAAWRFGIQRAAHLPSLDSDLLFSLPFIGSVVLTWIGLTLFEWRKERRDFVFAAIVSPLLSVSLYAMANYFFRGVPFAGAYMIGLVLLLNSAIILWPTSILISLICRRWFRDSIPRRVPSL